MASITSLADPWVTRIVAHVYAKHRADTPGKPDGEGNVTMLPNKKKFVRTAEVLLAQYGLDVSKKVVKANKVRCTCTLVSTCRCCCRCADGVRSPALSLSVPVSLLCLSAGSLGHHD